MSSVSNVAASRSGSTVTVTGTALSSVTIRALVNPTLTGNPTTQQIYNNFATIPAAGKGEKAATADPFSIPIDIGTTAPPYTVVVVTNDLKQETPIVEEVEVESVSGDGDTSTTDQGPAGGKAYSA